MSGEEKRGISDSAMRNFAGSPRSKILSAVWMITAVWIWKYLAGKSPDLIFTCLTTVFGVSVILHGLRRFWTLLSDRLICLGFSISSVTTFLFTSAIAGDWDPKFEVTHVCFNDMHLHHWWVYMLVLGFLMSIPSPDSIRNRKAWAIVAFSIAGLLGIMTILSLAGQLNGNNSFCIEATALAVFFGATAVLVLSKEVTSRWYRVYLGISFGVVLAIVGNGWVGTVKDLVTAQSIPGAFIFFNDTEGCKAK